MHRHILHIYLDSNSLWACSMYGCPDASIWGQELMETGTAVSCRWSDKLTASAYWEVENDLVLDGPISYIFILPGWPQQMQMCCCNKACLLVHLSTPPSPISMAINDLIMVFLAVQVPETNLLRPDKQFLWRQIRGWHNPVASWQCLISTRGTCSMCWYICWFEWKIYCWRKEMDWFYIIFPGLLQI